MFKLIIVTPEEKIYEDQVDEVLVSTTQGQLGILSHHINLVTQLIPGELRIKKGQSWNSMVIGSGILQMLNNELSIASDLAEHAAEIDEREAEEARKRAQEALEQTLTDEEYAETVAILEKSLAKLNVRRRHRERA